MDSILENLSHKTEPSAQKGTAAAVPAPQRKLTIRLPAGSNHLSEAAAATAPTLLLQALRCICAEVIGLGWRVTGCTSCSATAARHASQTTTALERMINAS